VPALGMTVSDAPVPALGMTVSDAPVPALGMTVSAAPVPGLALTVTAAPGPALGMPVSHAPAPALRHAQCGRFSWHGTGSPSPAQGTGLPPSQGTGLPSPWQGEGKGGGRLFRNVSRAVSIFPIIVANRCTGGRRVPAAGVRERYAPGEDYAEIPGDLIRPRGGLFPFSHLTVRSGRGGVWFHAQLRMHR